MPAATPSQAVASKYKDLASKHRNHLEDIVQLQETALNEVLPTVLHELGLDDDALAAKRVKDFLNDRATVFRFFRRSRYDPSAALSLLTTSLTWRLRTDLDSLSLSSLHPLYVSPPGPRPPLFWANTRFVDKYKRPCGLISLQSLERPEGSAGLDECREYIVGCMESVRRFLADSYREHSDVEENASSDAIEKPLQMVIAFSLQSSGMANLELELLPFLLDLLKNHYPGMVGAVFILHYGWVHAGMWGLAKRVLPQQALEKIFFPSSDGLLEFFDAEHLPRCFGGDLDVDIDDSSNDVMRKYARPIFGNKQNLAKGKIKAIGQEGGEQDDEEWERNSAPPSPRGRSGTASPAVSLRTPKNLSRSGSFDSLVDEFYSTENTPWGSRHITPRHSMPSTPRAEQPGFAFHEDDDGAGQSQSTLRMTPKAAQKLQHLQMTRGVGSSRPRTRSSPNPNAGVLGLQQGDEQGRNGSLPASRNHSRSSSPIRSRRLTAKGPVSTLSRGSKNVHFAGSEGRPSAESSPLHRVGSLRDFRLGNFTPGEGKTGIEPNNGGSEEEEEDGEAAEKDSVGSGKVSERTDGSQVANPVTKEGFFARWRKGSRGAETEHNEKEREYRQALARRQQETVVASGSPGVLHQTPLLSTNTVRGSGSVEQREAASLPSPQLQVPDMNEPPISGVADGNRAFSRRSRKFSALPGHVSPYNESNPFYGYPAYPAMIDGAALSAKSNIRAGGASGRGGFDLSITTPAEGYYPSHMRVRRRKRDLVRTLAYLFVLRLLSLHRTVRSRILMSVRQLYRALAVGGEEEGIDGGGEKRWKEAEERYRRLRSATSGTNRQWEEGQQSVEDAEWQVERDRRRSLYDAEQKRLQGQPLARLGIRKRYAILVVLLFILLKGNWRSNVLEGIDTIRALFFLGARRAADRLKGVSAAGVKREAGEVSAASTASASTEDEVLGVSSLNTTSPPDAALRGAMTVSSVGSGSWTGLHLRERLGLKST